MSLPLAPVNGRRWLFLRPLRVLAVVCALLIGGALAQADVLVKAQDGGFTVSTETYQAKFDEAGVLRSLKVGGEEFVAVLRGNAEPVYFYRGEKIPLEGTAEIIDEGRKLVAKGLGVSITWSFESKQITASIANIRRTPVNCFIIFYGKDGRISDGEGSAQPMPATITSDRVVLFRGNEKLAIAGGNKAVPFRSNQAWQAELSRGETRTVNLLFSEAALAKVPQLKAYKVADAGKNPVKPWRGLQYTADEIETIREAARTDARFEATVREWFTTSARWMRYTEEEIEAMMPADNALFADGWTSGDPKTGGTWEKRGGGGLCSLDLPGQVRSPFTGDVYGVQKEGERYYDDGTGWVRPEDGKRFYFKGVWNSYVITQMLGAVQNLARTYMLTGDEEVARRMLFLMDKMATMRSKRGNFDGPADWPYPLRQNQGFFCFEGNQANTQLYLLNLALDLVAQTPLAAEPSWTNRAEGQQTPSVLENIRDNLVVVIEPESMDHLQNHGLSAYSAFLSRALLFAEAENLRRGIGATYAFLDNCIDRDGEYYEVAASYGGLGYAYGGRLIELLRNYSPENYTAAEHAQAKAGGGLPALAQYPLELNFGNDPRWLALAVKAQYRLNVFGRKLNYGDSWPDREVRFTASTRELTLLRDAILYLYADTTRADWKEELAALYWSLPEYLRNRPTFGRGSAALWVEPHNPGQGEGAAPSVVSEESILLGGKATALLRSGSGEQARALFMRGGHAESHAHDDQLALALYGNGMLLTGEFGYGYWGTPDHVGFGTRAASHKTVVVDEDLPSSDALYRTSPSARIVSFLAEQPVQMVQMSNPDLWPEASRVRQYERQSWLIDIDAEAFYVVDIFRVKGGSTHDYFWNAPFLSPTRADDGFTIEGVRPVAEEGVWTLASQWNPEHRKADWNQQGQSWGERILGRTGQLRDQPEETKGRRWNPPPGNGYGFIYNVKSALTAGDWRASWDLHDDKTRLQLIMLNPDGEQNVVTANSGTLEIGHRHALVVARRNAKMAGVQEGELSSRFVALAQIAGKQTPWAVTSFEQLPIDVTADSATATVANLRDGGRDLLLTAADAQSKVATPVAVLEGGSGFARLDANGAPSVVTLVSGRNFTAGGIRIELAASAWSGRVLAVESGAAGNRVQVDALLPEGDALQGATLLFDSAPDAALPYANNEYYRIVSATAAADGKASLIDLGAEQSLVLSGLVVSKADGQELQLQWPNMTGGTDAMGAFNGRELVAADRSGRTATIVGKKGRKGLTLAQDNAAFKQGDPLEVRAVQVGDQWQIPAFAALRKEADGHWHIALNQKTTLTLPTGAAQAIRVYDRTGKRELFRVKTQDGSATLTLDPVQLQAGQFILKLQATWTK